MKKKKKNEESYAITPKGVLFLELGDEKKAQEVLDALELVAYRQNMNAIDLRENTFVKIYNRRLT